MSASNGYVAKLDRDYQYGRNLLRAAQFKPYRRQSFDPQVRPLRVYTSDPVQSQYDGGVSVVHVPYEPLDPGPCGSFLHVVQGDQIRGRPVSIADLEDRKIIMGQGLRPSTADPAFHHQMVYAVCSSVAWTFSNALGRDLSWGFDGPALKLRPHFCDDRNAYYHPDSGELRFGYFSADPAPSDRVLPKGTIYTCLSHDIVAHEMTHAVLDGMRARFQDPTNPDVLSFHEAFADLVAVLLHFSRSESVESAIVRSAGRLGGDGLIFSIAQEFGRSTGRNGPLRIALTATVDEVYYGQSDEPHELGSVLVRAIMSAFAGVYERRAAPLKALIDALARTNAPLHPAAVRLLAELASKTAEQFLALCIRAIDYCPPVDIRFGEYLRALITADSDLVENDKYRFRQELIAAFASRRIFPLDVADLSEDSLLWCGPTIALPDVLGLCFDILKLRPDPGQTPDIEEIEREAGALADVVTHPEFRAEFGLAPNNDAGLPAIESIRILRRVGPDRKVRFGLVCEVLHESDVEIDGVTTRLIGGSTIVMDSAGRFQYIIRKAADKIERAKAYRQFAASARGARQCRARDENRTWAALHAASDERRSI